MRVGVRELRDGLSRYLARAEAGEEILVTDRGRPVARLTGLGRKLTIDEMIARGIARPPLEPKTPIDDSRLPHVEGPPVSDIVIEQRRERPY